MRKIKFRAWIEPKGADFKAMANVSSIDFETRKIVVTFNNPYFAQTKFEFGDGDYTLMQSIGLKDKNGVEIYEGDIDGCDDELMYVAYEDGSFGLKYLNPTPGNEDYFDNYIDWGAVEIIGNIYENWR